MRDLIKRYRHRGRHRSNEPNSQRLSNGVIGAALLAFVGLAAGIVAGAATSLS